MRIFLRLLLAIAASLSLASVALAGDRSEKAADKADKATERGERGERGGGGSGDGPRNGKDGDRPGRDGGKPSDEERFADHPHGGPPGQLKGPGEPAHPEFTKFAERVGAEPTKGDVLVKLPGSDDFDPLVEGRSMPVGSVVDATAGLVEVMSEAAPGGTEQNAVVTGGVFRIAQDASTGITDLQLQGGDFSNCRNDDDDDVATARAAARKRKRKGGDVARGLWAYGSGRFRTSGRHSAATVRGTRWATVDRCLSTTVKVFEGVVDVKDFDSGRTIVLRAGERHVARERRD